MSDDCPEEIWGANFFKIPLDSDLEIHLIDKKDSDDSSGQMPYSCSSLSSFERGT